MDITALRNIVRVGTVSSVDVKSRTARVAFHDKQDTAGKPLISGPLKVVQSPPFISIGEAEEHTLTIRPWLPYVGQFVLCLYLPNGESDGFVIGGI